ncbi:candidapepsin-4 precursor [Sporothrix brasiliensis 5110]|uniref:Candidapepsin-4 n=1 Tax=Sporothrix brasiliensis 5110 TaxID=1398154 RepID=A0A0C2J0D7_9PEZI|nr:candidapepsin-4 precursor [Sporothrix brasiliensis 5110]KIH94831.1 candidapepsin-4 precursor [Sporothrix brasiliensis 5110]
MSRYLLPLALSAVSASVVPAAPAVDAGVAARTPDTGSLLSFPIVERRTYQGPPVRRRGVARRDDEAVLYNHTNVAYMIELGLGTPVQTVRVQLDTGSNELWVDPDCSTVTTSASQQFCESLGTYDPNKSRTFVDLEETTQLAYGRGSADIAYVSDTIVVPGSDNSTLKKVQFGVATASDDAAVPILGVGFGNKFNLDYNNLVDELLAQGVTNSRTLSLALGSATSDTGREDPGKNIGNGIVIFGGVDTKKFAGPLVKFDNLPPQAGDPGRPWRYWVQLDAVGFTQPGKATSDTYSGSSLPIVLDSGSSLSYLPQPVMDALAKSFGVKPQSDGSLIVDCNFGDKGGYVDFTFGSLVVSVPLSDFIWAATSDLCAVGALPSEDTTALLGDTFLRSAYVVFDQDNQNIYMAQAANCGSNEQVLAKGGNYNLTGECNVAQKSAAAGGLLPLSAAALFGLVGIQAVLSLL